MPSKPRCRLANWSDTSAMAEIAAQAYDQNDLCGRYMHPHRHEFPADYVTFFRQEIRSSFFEPGVSFLVTTAVVGKGDEGKEVLGEEEGLGGRGKRENEGGKEEEREEEGKGKGKAEQEEERVIVVGAAKWKRQGVGKRGHSSWINALLHPLLKHLTHLSRHLSPLRSANPQVATHLSDAYSLITHHWTGPRAETYFLDMLCVAPRFQHQGHGRALVQWGKDRAREEGVCASLTSAEDKEPFYEKLGFVQVGRANVGPLEGVLGGAVMFWDEGMRGGEGVRKKEEGRMFDDI